MKVYLDFDGTMVKHMYPAVGEPNPKAIEVVKSLFSKGWKIHLNTYRADIGFINEALDYINKAKIPLESTFLFKLKPPEWDINKAKKESTLWIDDIAPFIPMKNSMVDWEVIEEQLKMVKIL
mgnify:CR=1 FL=1